MADFERLSTIGITVKVNNVAIAGVTEFGDLGGDPTMLDATVLTDEARVNVLGVQEQDNWTLSYVWNRADYQALNTAAASATPVAIEVAFPEGDTFTNTGTVSNVANGASVNAVRMGRASIALGGKWVYTAGSNNG